MCSTHEVHSLSEEQWTGHQQRKQSLEKWLCPTGRLHKSHNFHSMIQFKICFIKVVSILKKNTAQYLL